MANFCENCGSPLKNDNKFCPNCGAPVKDADVATPVTSGATDAPQTNAVIPNNSPSTAAAPDTASATFGTAGVAAAATVGALHPEPVPAKPQESFVPPRQQPSATQQNSNEKTGTEEKSTPPSLIPESRQDIPHPDYNQQTEFAKGSTGPKYEPDTDLQSKFLRFDNRLNRKRYILRSLVLFAAIFIMGIILIIVLFLLNIDPSKIRGLMIGRLITFVFLIPSYSLMVRRFHDLNRPGWWCIPFIIQTAINLFLKSPENSFLLWCFGALISLISFCLSIYLLFFKGTDGPNQYGPDPLEVQD